MIRDPLDIGWWLESADEEIYGPASRQTLRRFLSEGVISTNTLVRHCTRGESRPVADQPQMTEGVSLSADAPATGDRLRDAWPRRRRERLALAESTIPCRRHSRPAVLVCLRCQSPYCDKCRMKTSRRPFYLCRRCQANLYNRRFGAILVDGAIFSYLPMLITVPLLVATSGSSAATAANYLVQGATGLLFIFRDALFRGAGPGKRVFGLRVVSHHDGATPVSYGQGFVRWLSQLIPVFNLVDAAIPYYDPLLRRFGDRWAKTRVSDSPRKSAKVREKMRNRLATRGVEFPAEWGTTMEQFAQIAG